MYIYISPSVFRKVENPFHRIDLCWVKLYCRKILLRQHDVLMRL